MSALTAWVLVGVCAAIFGIVVTLMLRADREEVRAAREAPTQRLRPVVGWLHEAPAEPFNVPQAHRVMQQHRLCHREDCGRKRAAYTTLVEARRLRPDSGRNY
ncbi:hypothetical protein KO481_21435 [Nocardia sp. NEAU-G5]|uniref:Uncharacterized protein n=1 Tax=Nocardia albiluteola TaxID=2842303 RepID=A0ABS6B1A9_9NOCA|nr:hypothetical protein [Nocardia albiluteola]MBU3064082.1 hypothetical protein [Nocardia albiluteola]